MSEPSYAIVRVDRTRAVPEFLEGEDISAEWRAFVQIEMLVSGREEAEQEAKRLNGADTGRFFYFWQQASHEAAHETSAHTPPLADDDINEWSEM